MVTPHTLRVDFEGRTGLTPTFDFLKDHSDANLAQPAISEIAGTDGVYKFTLADIDAGVFGRVDPGDGGTGASFDIGPQVLDTLAADLATIDGKVDVIDTNVDAILVDTDEIQGKLPSDAGNMVSPAQSNTEADQALTDYDGPTKAELDTAEANIIAEVDANEVKIDAVKVDTAAIKSQTDQIGFSAGGNVEADMQEIDGVAVDDNDAGNLNPTGGDVDWLEAEREQIRDALGVNGTKTAAIGGQVQDILDDTADIQPTVAANLDAAVSTRATPAQVGAELDSRRLDDLVTDGSAAAPVDGSLIDQIMNKDAGQTFDAAVDSLEAQSDRLQVCVPVGQRIVVLTFEDDVSGDPIAGALVTVRTSPGGALVLANQLTDASGQITVNLDDGAYTQTASKLPDYLSFTPTIFTVTNIATAFTFTGTSTIPPPPPAGDPIKCNVIADSFQNVVEGMQAEASIIGEDVMTIGNNLLDESEATVKVTADSAGRFTFPLIRATQLKQKNGVAVTYRVRIRDIGFDAKILVPDLATAFLGDIITAN